MRDDLRAEPEGVIGDSTKIGPIYDVHVTRHYGRYGVEVLIDSLGSDESKSWVVMGRGVVRYATELSTECTWFMHPDTRVCESEAHSTEKPVAAADIYRFLSRRTYSNQSTCVATYRMFLLIRSVGLSTGSCSVTLGVLSSETEVVSRETLFHWVGAPLFQ